MAHMIEGSLRFLGTGSSAGVPLIGCHCPVCSSQDPKNRRFRVSALLKYNTKILLIDAGPDIRQQALQYHIDRIDGLLLTHTHYDHVGGLEELRVYNFRQKHPLPCLLSDESYQSVKKLFYYLFDDRNVKKSFTSQFDFMPLKERVGNIVFMGLPVRYFTYEQGGMGVLGFRFGDLAYVTDIKSYQHTIFEELQGLSTLIVSALRFTPSEVQFSIDEAVDFAQKVKAKNSYLVHMSHDIEYTHVLGLLPADITLAYDGLELPFHIKTDETLCQV